MSFGTLLRKARQRSGIPITLVSKTTGISVSALYHMEGPQATPSIKSVYTLAILYGMKPTEVSDLVLSFGEMEEGGEVGDITSQDVRDAFK